MNGERLFLDTAFVQALLNRHDQYHDQVKILLPRVRAAAQVWTTEAILIEIGNALTTDRHFEQAGSQNVLSLP